MKKITLLCVMGMLCLQLMAQSPPVRPLSIGDTVPDIVLTNVYNYPDSVIRLSDLRGKLVILDFWATWCLACIKEFSKLESLQSEYKNDLQVLMVNSDPSENETLVKRFFKKQRARTGKESTLPYSLKNEEILGIFPHKEIPHYIWINRVGRIVGISGSGEVNTENVNRILTDDSYTIFTKKDYRFNPSKPLLIDENGGDNPYGFLYRSIITGYKEGLNTVIGMTDSEEGSTKRLYAINCDLLTLLKIAYRKVFKDYGSDRILVESKKYTLEHFLDTKVVMRPENRYCYEIFTSSLGPHRLLTLMQQDIYRQFAISARNEVRLADCYVLKSVHNEKLIQTRGGEPLVDVEEDTMNKVLRNQPTSVLISRVINPLVSWPVIDETGLTYNLDLDFPTDFLSYDVGEIKKYLSTKGLELSTEKRKIEFVIISDRVTQ